MRWLRRKWAAVEAWLGPFRAGMLFGLAAATAVAGLLFWASELGDLASPSQALLRDLAGFGGALFIAYSVAFGAVALSDRMDLSARRSWVGYGVGIGTSGLLGVGAAIAAAANVEAGHGGALDVAGLCAAVSGVLMMGVSVLGLPASELLDDEST